jgi:hypothetical protein
MPKPRSTLPIAHADGVLPTIAFTDEKWQAIERAYGRADGRERELNADVRQQITTVTTQYLNDCAFERTVVPKAMARERIERIRRAARDLEKAMLDPARLLAKGGPLYSGGTHCAPVLNAAGGRLPKSRMTENVTYGSNYYVNHLIRRHFTDPRLAARRRRRRDRRADKLYHFQGVLTSLVVACDCALGDLSAAEGYRGGEAWNCWIQALMRIAQEHSLPFGVSTELDKDSRPSPFVRLVQELERYLPANARSRKRSPAALAMAISRARNT